MANFSILPATQVLLNRLKGKLREIDEKESEAILGTSGDAAMQLSFEVSQLCWVGLIDDIVYCIFGVAAREDGVGVPWFLASEDLEKAQIFTLRESKNYVKKMVDNFDFLENYVHVDNNISKNWLKWCGFTIDAPISHGVREEFFHRFWLERGGAYV